MNVMCSYNGDHKKPAAGSDSCTNHRILETLLRGRLGFHGFVISDLGAVDTSVPESLVAGMDVYLGKSPTASTVQSWIDNETSPLHEARLDQAVSRSLLARFLEGEFEGIDPLATVAYWNYSCDKIGDPAHRQLAYEAAQQSLVLLKNNNLTLPLRVSKDDAIENGGRVPIVAVIGPFATHARWMYNRYAKVPLPGSPLLVSLADALASRSKSQTFNFELRVEPGCTDANTTTVCKGLDEAAVDAAVDGADVIVVAVGSGEPVESETGRSLISQSLPGAQAQLLQRAHASGGRTVAVLFTTSPKTGRIDPHSNASWIDSYADALLSAFYPQNGGAAAIADTLLGLVSPAGRMPTSWPTTSWTDGRILPGRLLEGGLTYRYNDRYNDSSSPHGVLFPFGFGLSYTEFHYSDLHVSPASLTDLCANVTVTARVSNVGDMGAAEVVQLYLAWGSRGAPGAAPTPRLQMAGFEKIFVPRGKSVEVKFVLQPRHFAVLRGAATNASTFLDGPNGAGGTVASPLWVVESQKMQVWVGGQQPHQSVAAPSNVLSSRFEVIGEATPVKHCPGGTPS